MIIDIIKRTALIEVRIGPRGRAGEDGGGGGASLPTGGTTGQVLAKVSNTDGDADWISLGGAAALNVGTTSGTVCAGDDSRLSNSRTPTAHTHDQSDITGLSDTLSSKADLVGGKVPSSQIPSIALTEFLGPVSSEAAMILLTGDPGDYCFRTDVGLAYFLTTGTGSSVGNWQAVSTPATSGVVSVNGQDGVVVLGPEDIGFTFPIAISDGGTGAETASAARVALGIDEVIAGVAQVITVAIGAPGQSGWAGQYVDIDDGSSVCRFWFTVDGVGSAPSTPSPGRLQVVAINDGDSASAVESAFLTAIAAQSSAFNGYGTAGGSFTVTNTAAAAAPDSASSIFDIVLTVTTTGVDASSRLAAADGSQLTNINAATIPGPSTVNIGGVYASEGSVGQFVKGVDTSGNLLYDSLPTANTDTRLYTSNDTWVNPSPTIPRRVFVRLVGGGGGGGSGRKGVAGVNRFGGGGGAAGAVTEFWTLTTELAATRPVTVGAGGTGGAAVSADTTNGNAGTAGGDTNFAGLTAIGGNNGGGGGASSGLAGSAVANSCIAGVVSANNTAGGAGGAVAGVAGATANAALPTGGGGGGGLDASNTNRAGGTGGIMGATPIVPIAGGTAGTSGGGAGGVGNAGRGSGTGGGGGGSNGAGPGGAGGNGAGFGSGGGGGAAGTNSVGNSGAGGNGAPGYALIITY